MSADLDRLHEAYVAGDLAKVRAALGNPAQFPNVRDECGETCLEYALYHAPLALVRELLEAGADANYASSDGSPSLFAALSSNHADRCARAELLLDFGADIQQRGINDYTPLHHAATTDNAAAVRLLIARRADPTARTRVDNYGTPLQEAEHFGHSIGAQALRSCGVTS